MTECDFCGCTDHAPCRGGCHWVLPGLCSSCEIIIDKVCGACGNLIAATNPVQTCSNCSSDYLEDYREPSQVLEILENLDEISETVEA